MRRALAFTLLLPLGCQDYLFEQKCASSVTETQLMRPAVKPTPADILFVVDNSGSMLDDQERLAASFDRFVERIAGRGDHQIAVITTDVAGRGEWEGASVALHEPNFPYASVYPNQVNRDGCSLVAPAIPNGCFRGADPARRVVKTSDPDAVATLAQTLIVGSCGSGDERGLDALTLALEQMGPGGCNQGFLRKEANLVVILVSDEDDHGDAEVGRALDAMIRAKDGNARQVRAGVIVGSVDGQAAACNSTLGAACGSYCDTPIVPGSHQRCTSSAGCAGEEVCANSGSYCDTVPNLWREFGEPGACGSCSYFRTEDCCTAFSGERYVRFAEGVENRVTDDDRTIPRSGCRPGPNQRSACVVETICQDNFGDTLERFANQLIQNDSYALDPPAANPSGVLVSVRGGRYGEGRTLEPGVDYLVSADGTLLSFVDAEASPDPGTDEVLDITYVVEVRTAGTGQGACAGR